MLTEFARANWKYENSRMLYIMKKLWRKKEENCNLRNAMLTSVNVRQTRGDWKIISESLFAAHCLHVTSFRSTLGNRSGTRSHYSSDEYSLARIWEPPNSQRVRRSASRTLPLLRHNLPAAGPPKCFDIECVRVPRWGARGLAACRAPAAAGVGVVSLSRGPPPKWRRVLPLCWNSISSINPTSNKKASTIIRRNRKIRSRSNSRSVSAWLRLKSGRRWAISTRIWTMTMTILTTRRRSAS